MLSFQILELHYLLSMKPVKFSRKQLLWLFKNLELSNVSV